MPTWANLYRMVLRRVADPMARRSAQVRSGQVSVSPDVAAPPVESPGQPGADLGTRTSRRCSRLVVGCVPTGQYGLTAERRLDLPISARASCRDAWCVTAHRALGASSGTRRQTLNRGGFRAGRVKPVSRGTLDDAEVPSYELSPERSDLLAHLHRWGQLWGGSRTAGVPPWIRRRTRAPAPTSPPPWLSPPWYPSPRRLGSPRRGHEWRRRSVTGGQARGAADIRGHPRRARLTSDCRGPESVNTTPVGARRRPDPGRSTAVRTARACDAVRVRC